MVSCIKRVVPDCYHIFNNIPKRCSKSYCQDRHLMQRKGFNRPSSSRVVSQNTSTLIKKLTIRSRFSSIVSHHLTNDTINQTDYEDVIKNIHHQTVRTVIQIQPPNPYLKTFHQQASDPVEKNLFTRFTEQHLASPKTSLKPPLQPSVLTLTAGRTTPHSTPIVVAFTDRPQCRGPVVRA